MTPSITRFGDRFNPALSLPRSTCSRKFHYKPPSYARLTSKVSAARDRVPGASSSHPTAPVLTVKTSLLAPYKLPFPKPRPLESIITIRDPASITSSHEHIWSCSGVSSLTLPTRKLNSFLKVGRVRIVLSCLASDRVYLKASIGVSINT